jgi:F-type H+-transporting ATPase subunit epsilon
MATIHCDIVSAEKEIFSGVVSKVSLVGSIGELGILPGHAPLLTGIRPGPVNLTLENGEDEVFFASGGYLEVQPGIITILADTAARAEDLDEAAAIEAREAAKRAIAEQEAGVDFGVAAAQLAEALAQSRTLEELRKRRR